jgi:hypothetical protein
MGEDKELGMEEQKREHVDLLGPVLLIAVGIILLLNVLGILEWGVWWTIIQLWPVFLIALGLEILIGRRSIWGSLLVVVLTLTIAAGALWLSQTGAAGGRAALGEQVSHPLDGATEATVVVEPGVGVLRVEALPEAANLVEGNIQLADGENLDQDLDRTADRATLELRTTRHGWNPFRGSSGLQRVWELGLSPAPLLRLNTNLGLGEARLDLTGLALSDLQTDMGVGYTRVTLPAQGNFQVSIDGAVGMTTVVMPSGLEARIHADSGLAVRVLPDSYRRDGDVYTSPGYNSAEDRVDLTLSQAIGLLEVQTQD